jgi:hypothetical protein
MRKIKAVDMRVPDADRIEGIVKSGQLNRHGSIRRKIVPQPQDFINDSLYSDQSESSPVKFTSTPNHTFAELDLANDTIFIPEQPEHDEYILMPYSNKEFDKETNLTPSAENPNVMSTEIAPLDDGTLLKIKDCLDAEKVKDIYTLGSTLQDLLSAAEVEEIISNSHRYSNVISQEILIALSESRTPDGFDPAANKNKTESGPEISPAVSSAPPDLIDSQDSKIFIFLFIYLFTFFFLVFCCQKLSFRACELSSRKSPANAESSIFLNSVIIDLQEILTEVKQQGSKNDYLPSMTRPVRATMIQTMTLI